MHLVGKPHRDPGDPGHSQRGRGGRELASVLQHSRRGVENAAPLLVGANYRICAEREVGTHVEVRAMTPVQSLGACFHDLF